MCLKYREGVFAAHYTPLLVPLTYPCDFFGKKLEYLTQSCFIDEPMASLHLCFLLCLYSYTMFISRRYTVHLLDTDTNDSLTVVCADPEKHRVATQ